jgi:hypothetical protein
MPTIPNFYKIDCEREVVLQGRSSSFVTITRNDAAGGISSSDTLFILPYIQANTFETQAVLSAVPNPSAGAIPGPVVNFTYTQNGVPGSTGGVGPFSGQVPGFSHIANGAIVKNWYDIDPALPPDTPLIVGNVTSSTFSITTPGGTVNINPIGTAFEIGEYAVDGNSWRVNGGNALYQTNTENNSSNILWTPFDTTQPNLFDGTIFGTYGDDTGLFGRNTAGRWIGVEYDVNNTQTRGATFRIDYDGLTDSHLKLNFLILALPNNTNNSNSIIPADPAITPYGLKSRTTGDNTSDYQEIHFIGYREDYVRPSRDNASLPYTLEKTLYDDRSSYALLKTNPKISGNVKLTIDAKGSLWLNSFSANDELSNASYKKFPVSANSTYQKDLYTFFKEGTTPPSTVFALYQEDDQYLNNKTSFAQQYDNFYNYGVEQLNSKFYDENFSFLAPIWLRKSIPDYFIIFRVNGPVNIDSYKSVSIDEKINDFFKEARIVKTYDMRSSSKLGGYLRNLVNDPRFKERPLEVSWETDIATYWNGIAYQNGTMTGKGEFLYDFFKEDRPIKELEEYITNGFERNGIISTNLVNLEFLFDDEEAPLYGINRYYGLYVTENQLAEFEIEPTVLGKIADQTPSPKPKVDGEPYSTRSFVQTNPNGIQLPVHYYHNASYQNNTSIIPEYQGLVAGKFPLPAMVDDPLRFFYVKDRNDIFKRVNRLTEIDYGTPGSSEYIRATQLQLFDTQEDISSYGGVNEIVAQFPAQLLNSGKSQTRLHIIDQNGTGVFANDEEIRLEVRRYNDPGRKNTYYIQVTSVVGNDVTVEYLINQDVTQLTANFTQPAVGLTVTISVIDSSIFSAGEQVYIIGGGYYKVSQVNTATSVTLQNLGLPGNALPAATVLTDSFVGFHKTGDATYTLTALNSYLNIDNYLTISLIDFSSPYVINDAWRVEVDYPSLEVFLLAGSNNLNAFYKPDYQQFTWVMDANGVGLQPGDAWDYPVYDPDGAYYRSTFSNEGTAEQVAKALAKCANSFENSPVQAWASGNIVYMRSNLLYEDGNDIVITRVLRNASEYANLGFYESGNVNRELAIKQLSGSPYSSIDLKPAIVESIDDPKPVSFYLSISRGTNSWVIFGRKGADVSTYASATTTGTVVWRVVSDPYFTENGIPLSLDLSQIPENSGVEIAYTVSGATLISQNFIGGVKRNRNRARISFANGQKYFSDRRIKKSSLIVAGSKTITVNTENLYVGSSVVGKGIPIGATIVDVNANSVIIDKEAASTNSVTLSYGEFSILNSSLQTQQWYQAQKGLYSRMKAWKVQGKYIYSLPYLEEPVYDEDEYLNGFTDLNDYSIIQLEDTTQEFFISIDDRIVAYKLYRPILGIFSIFPVKEFDFDFVFSDYSYTPTLEVLPYFFKETLKTGESVELPLFENFQISLKDAGGKLISPRRISALVDNSYSLKVEAYDAAEKTWVNVEWLRVRESASDGTQLIFNTFYPLYDYDETEYPLFSVDGSYTPVSNESPYSNSYQFRGVGKRNFNRKHLLVNDVTTGETVNIFPEKFRITYIPSTVFTNYLEIENYNYSTDRDLPLFNGFAGLQDIEGIQDADDIQTFKEQGKYIEAFTYQLLLSEYDRLRENFNKDFAVKSKVVPYINKWVQEGTDARDNYYRLNNSLAFGINNLSPNDQLNFAETSVLTHEFPYLDSFPKNYPDESLDFSRSYMFAKLSDIAYSGKSWYDLMSTDDSNDWFTKYFSVGYPTEKTFAGEIVPKSREERYTFFTYNQGLGRSQTLFRGGKIQGILKNTLGLTSLSFFADAQQGLDYITLVNGNVIGNIAIGDEVVGEGLPIGTRVIGINPTSNRITLSNPSSGDKTSQLYQIINYPEITNSTGLDSYKFAAITRFTSYNSYEKETPVEIEFIKNDKYKSILMVITVRLEDYRTQHGHYDYAIQYFMNDILKNQNQQQKKFNPFPLLKTSGQLRNFLPYSNGFTAFSSGNYESNAILRPRQGFLGGGYLQLGNKKLGGLLDYVNNQPIWNNAVFSANFEGINNTVPFNLQEELTTIQNGYRFPTSYPFIYNTGLSGFIVAKEYGQDGFLFSIHSILKTNVRTIMRSVVDNQSSNDVITPLNIQLGSAQKNISFNVTPPTNEVYPPNFWGLIGNSTNVIDTTYGSLYQKSVTAIEGGTQGFISIKNFLTFGNISSLINSEDSAIKYYKVEGGKKVETIEYRFKFVSPDQIIKTNVLHYSVDTDKPQEYLNTELIGYNLVDTNLQEYMLRHRGYYEPKSRDILSFWLREDNEFSRHFEKDYLLSNTHINSKSDFSLLIQNYGINKVSTSGNILNISRGSSYKSLYPLIGEVAVDTRNCFSLDGSWDNDFYRNYASTINFTDVEGLVEMKEIKSFLASKAMNVPKIFEFHTFDTAEVSSQLIAPAVEIGVNNLVANQTVRDQSKQDADKPKLIINVDLRKRLKRQLTEEMTNGVNTDEFELLRSYNVPPMNAYSNADIDKLRSEYLDKNIINLYETTDIILYVKNQEGIELLDINLSELEKVTGGYKVDKDCVVKKLETFVYQIEKTLDPKVASGFSLSANVKRI